MFLRAFRKSEKKGNPFLSLVTTGLLIDMMWVSLHLPSREQVGGASENRSLFLG